MRSICFGLIISCVSALCQNSSPPPGPTAVFQRARARLLADTKRMPRYTCEQSIVRYFYKAESSGPQSCATILARRERRRHGAKPVSWDRLQLDVAIADDGEVHSWPGAPRFNEEEIRKLVNNGPFGSGDFSAFVSGIFAGGATIRFDGSRSLNGRTLFAYTFAVPKNFSHYRIATGEASLITAYDGSFLLDPQTADLVQLTVRTAELPEATKSCQALSQMDYGRIDIHGRAVLIPSRADLRMIYRDGREAVATTSYSNCHEYTSKAVLHFDEPAAREARSRTESPAHPAAASALPEGIAFDCRIVTPIDSDTPAGRPIEGVLRSALRDKDKTILAPRGAHIHGRLVRLADHKGALDYFEVGVRLESIELEGAEVPLHARLADQAAPPINYLSWDDRKEMLADFPAAPPRNVGVFFFVLEKLRVPHIDSAWVTTSAEVSKPGQVAKTEVSTKQETHAAEPGVAATPKPVATPDLPAKGASDANAPIVLSLGGGEQALTATPPSPAPAAPSAQISTTPPQAEKTASAFPRGAVILAELAKSLDAKKTKVGDKIEATTTTDSVLPGHIELARGTRIEGHVSNVKTKSKGSRGSMVELVFDHALASDGRELPLHATLQAVGRPLVKAPAAMDNLIVSPGASLPANSAPSGNGTRSMAPPPSEPPQVSNPDAGLSTPEEQDAGALTAKSQGVVGLQGLSLSAFTGVSIISAEKGNVHLDGGTQLVLRTQ